MRINVRPLVKELLENENLIVSYSENENGEFDLSVRIDEKALNSISKEIGTMLDKPLVKPKEEKPDPIIYVPVTDLSEQPCPHCGSKNTKELYGTAALPADGKAQILTAHFICQDCMTEFDVNNK